MLIIFFKAQITQICKTLLQAAARYAQTIFFVKLSLFIYSYVLLTKMQIKMKIIGFQNILIDFVPRLLNRSSRRKRGMAGVQPTFHNTRLFCIFQTNLAMVCRKWENSFGKVGNMEGKGMGIGQKQLDTYFHPFLAQAQMAELVRAPLC